MEDAQKPVEQITFDDLRRKMLDKYQTHGKLAEYAFLVAWEERYTKGAGEIEKFFQQLAPLFLAPTTGDRGHDALLVDLIELYNRAYEFQYHDFRSEDCATPKIALVESAMEIVTNTKNGIYDNESPKP